MFSKLRNKKNESPRGQDKEEKSEKAPQASKQKRDYDYQVKLLMVGDIGVGKNAIMTQFTDFVPILSVTSLDIMRIKTIEIDGNKVKIQVWDTAGQERYRTMTTACYTGAHGVMIVFDVTNLGSFRNISKNLRFVEAHAKSDLFMLLVGNGCHNYIKRVIDYATAKAYAQENGYSYIEVSDEENVHITEAFIFMVRNIIAKLQGRTDSQEALYLPYPACRATEAAEHSHTSTLVHSPLEAGDDKVVETHHQPLQADKSQPSRIQPSDIENQATLDKSIVWTDPDSSKPHEANALVASEEVQLLKRQIDDKNREIHQKNEINQKLEESVKGLEESIQTARLQLQQREQQLKKNFDTIQNVQSRLKQSEEKVQEAQDLVRRCEEVIRASREQIREKEQQAVRNGETIRALEDRVKELEEEVAESQQHLTDVEQQLHQAEHRLTNSDQVFQDIFQRLLGQIPQSQPHWVVQRNEIALTGEELGTGGWASVKVALFRGQCLAAKCLHHQIISAHNIRLFTREMTMAAQARHPNLLQFIGATMDNNPIILTELMPTSLRRILEQGVRLTRAQIVSIASDVARALNYLHLNTPDPIIHRDISSANVLLEETGDDGYKAKVSDYGSANFSRYTATAGPGNPLYSAPESGDPRRQSVKMDVYSFGLLLVEMCSGELFDDHEELIRTRIGDWPDMVRAIRPCIHRDPKRRPNMSDVITQLTQIQS